MIMPQICGSKVLATKVVDCLFAVKREPFLPARYRNLTHNAVPLPSSRKTDGMRS